MQNTRLITFGCSITFGQGLEDCYKPEVNQAGDEPSKYAWPSVLATHLSLPLINKSLPGSSNLQILKAILEFDFQESDLVIVMWSHPDRDLLFLADGDQPVGAWSTSDLAKRWALTHDTCDLATKSWYHIHHANLFFKDKNIRQYNFFANYFLLMDYKPNFVDVIIHDIDVPTLRRIDTALDKKHPGPLTQKAIAEKIKERINAN